MFDRPPDLVTRPVEDLTRGNTSLIEVRNLYKVFATAKGRLVALENINLSVGPGEFVSLVGPSGCGKSTLLNIIGGLLPKTRGRVLFGGQEQSRPRREIGMMFQTPVLFPWRTVESNVMLPIEILKLPKAESRRRAREILELVGLSGFEHSYPAELSGGMRQRVALSRLLVYDPTVLLMDEPFGALDEFTRETMNLELLRIWNTTNKTVMFVTHNITEAVFLSDRVFVLTPRPGRLAGIVETKLPRPRTREMMRHPEFLERVFTIRELLGVAT